MTCRWPEPPRPTENQALRNLALTGQYQKPEPTALFSALADAYRVADIEGFDLTGRRILRTADDT